MPTYGTKKVAGLRSIQRHALVLVCVLAFSGPPMAQGIDPETAGVRVAPALVDPAISTSELAHRLVPLTKAELDPLARAWLDIVRTKTEEIAERQVELLQDPSAATDEAYQDLARMVEERASLFERFSMVVDALQGKGGDEALVRELRAYRNSVLFSETVLASPKAIARALFTWLTRADGGVPIAKDIGIALLALVALVFVSKAARGSFAAGSAAFPAFPGSCSPSWSVRSTGWCWPWGCCSRSPRSESTSPRSSR